MLGRLQFSPMTLLFVLFATNMLWSQKSQIRAERQFQLKAYELAIENSKKALETNPDCLDCHYLIAESFRLMNRNVDAAIWYKKMEHFDKHPKDYYLNYGLLMKKMGQYKKARQFFENYREQDAELALHYIESCDFATAILSEPINFELNLYPASSKHTDFGASFYKDNIIFASFRDDFKRDLNKLNKSHIHNNKSQLFIGGLGTTGTINTVNFLLDEDPELIELGPVHYASEAPVCVVTRNNFRDGEQQIFADDLELSLYLADVAPDGSFKNISAYPFNEVGFATGFGTLNASGNILYFASNRPGGYGGFDIYVSYYKNNAWTYPENLGPRINSRGNEVTPFYNGESLFFSSDYWKGLGGFDVFQSQVQNGRWLNPGNMGNGINSPEDDFYFIKHPEKPSYYITSNRLGGKGSYDIYIVNKADENVPILELAYEDVVPAEVNIDEELVENTKDPEILNVNLPEVENMEELRPVESSTVEKMDENIALNENLETNSNSPEFDEILPPKAVDLNSYNSRAVSLVGARLVAYGEVINKASNVYFIQLAALFKSSGNIDAFIPLKKFGSLYKVKQSNAIKVKLGYFDNESKAKEILQSVRNLGYYDAFITFEALNTSKLELVELAEETARNTTLRGFRSDETTGVNFKVRLASYEDPIWFDIESVKDLGIIEQWSKDQWTIFILGGFSSLEEAETALVKARTRGFNDAEIVLDRNGILERFR